MTNKIKILKKDGAAVLDKDYFGLKLTQKDGVYTVSTNAEYDGVFGLGEKFDRVNQKGNKVLSSVIEKCFDQGEFTYCPVPFFFTPNGWGIFVDTLLAVNFDFTYHAAFSFKEDCNGKLPDIYLFEGTPAQILDEFTALTGRTKKFPKWVFGAWMSSNKWASREDILNQIDEMDRTKLPHNVMVIENWSDETSYYIWRGSKCRIKEGNESYKLEDFDFSSSPWGDISQLIDTLHKKGIKVLLWELPVYAGLNTVRGGDTAQLIKNNEWAEKNRECVMDKEGKPYIIPNGNWYGSSMIPDFTNPDTRKNWFSKKQYLLDMGIDGFKTDGGEFVYKDEARFHNGLTGAEMKNGYVQSYLKAYSDFVGEDRVIYSRAGYTSQQTVSTHWAGDQQSNWNEYRAVMRAGINATASGIAVWGFDIAGFSGYLPSRELYSRSTQAGVFTPIMQWHSEPIYNGPCDEKGIHKNNDRSPWNMADYYKSPEFLHEMSFHYNLRSNLIPYLYELMLRSRRDGLPIMRHPVIMFPQDEKCVEVNDQFMLGDIMVAPVLFEGQKEREVYLPKGVWTDLFSGKKVSGGRTVKVKLTENITPAYVKENSCISLNLGDSLELGSYVGNEMDSYKNLTFLLTGKGEHEFLDDLQNRIVIKWDESGAKALINEKNLPIVLKILKG